MDLFLLKKIISEFIMPLSIIIILLICAIVFYQKRPSFSFKCLITGTLLLIITTLPPISDRLINSFENNYESFSRSSTPVDYIIILGCMHETNDALPVTSQLKVCSLQRLVEALRIFKLHPEATIITSGYKDVDPVSNAEKVKQAAILLGIPSHKIITENFPKDTEEEAQLIAPRVIGTNVVLVTNANHMPRSMKYFQAQGVYPIAAPAGYWVKNIESEKTWDYYVPSAKKLAQTTTAWYETLGQIVQWFKSLFD